MGARYWCSVCEVRVAGGTDAVRVHRAGLHHQLLTRQHYHQYRDVEEVLAEESRKVVCERAQAGRCVFGLLCRRSHYAPADLHRLHLLAAERRAAMAGRGREAEGEGSPRAEYERVRAAALQRERASSCSVLRGGEHCALVPWRGRHEGEQLPPSLRPLALHDFAWGRAWPPDESVYSALWTPPDSSPPSPAAAAPAPAPLPGAAPP